MRVKQAQPGAQWLAITALHIATETYGGGSVEWRGTGGECIRERDAMQQQQQQPPLSPQVARPRPAYEPASIDDPNYVRIFDTTLRDGEQSPGATLTSKEKIEIAKMLSKLGVDIIEAGFPIASPDDFDAVRNIAMEVGNAVDPDTGYVPVICGLSRTKEKDLETAWDAVRHAKRPRVHTFIATSKIHMDYKLRMTPDQVVQQAVNAVKHLRCAA